MTLRLGPTDRRIIALGVPALGTLAVEPLYRLVDTAIVGRIGTDELGGVAIAVTVLTLVVAGSNFLTYGTTERVAHRIGAGRPDDAAAVGVQAMWLAVIVGAIAAPLLYAFAPALTRLLGADGAVHDAAVEYLRIASLGIPFVLIALGAQGVQRGASDYRTPLVILLASNVVNLVLALTFVYALDMGLAGTAWSTVVAQAAAGVAFVLVIRRRLAPARAPAAELGRHAAAAQRRSLPAVAGRFDPRRVHGCDRTGGPRRPAHRSPRIRSRRRCSASSPSPSTRWPSPRRPSWPRNSAATTATAADLSARVVRLSLMAAAALALVLALLSSVLPHAFTDDPAVIERATSALRYLALMLLPGAVAFGLDGVLIGAADYRFLGRAAFGYLLAVLPIAAVVIAFPSLGLAGIWIGLLVWMILRAVVNTRRAAQILPQR